MCELQMHEVSYTQLQANHNYSIQPELIQIARVCSATIITDNNFIQYKASQIDDRYSHNYYEVQTAPDSRF
jgi:hypothetical protein